MVSPIVECQSVSKSYGKSEALHDIHFQLQPHEFLALLGPSGSGKSTILRLLGGFDLPDQGEIYLNGKKVSSPNGLVPPEERKIGFVFQDFALFPHLSVAENIAFGLKGPRQDKEQRVMELLNLVNLGQSVGKMPSMLSGGEQQRVAVARAMARKPDLILLDEPFSNLDYQMRNQLRQEIWDILRMQQISVILVTHDQEEAFMFADRVVVIKDGRIVQEGDPFTIYHHPCNRWIASFVGEANFFVVESQELNWSTPLGLLQKTEQVSPTHALMMVRPEDFSFQLVDAAQANVVIERSFFQGDHQLLIATTKSGQSLRIQSYTHNSYPVGSPLLLRVDHYQIIPPD